MILSTYRFKATELRLLTLYILPVALVKFPLEIYNHFLLLHCAIRIFCCQNLSRRGSYVERGRCFLKTFVHHCSRLYEHAFISSNVHNLIHLANQVLRFGSLDFVSCWPFENHIQVLKNLVQPTFRPLAQLVNRIMERRQNPCFPKPIPPPQYQLLRPHNKGPVIPLLHGASQFKSLLLGQLKISIHCPNNCVVLKNAVILLIENIVCQTDKENAVMIIGRKLQRAGRELYDYPMSASSLGIYVVNDFQGPLECYHISYILYKAMKIPIPNSAHEFAVIELLHSDTSI